MLKFAMGSSGAEPCNPGGVSPSLRAALTCITGPLLTKRNCAWCLYDGMTLEELVSDTRHVSHRVERPSQVISSKVFPLLPTSPEINCFNSERSVGG